MNASVGWRFLGFFRQPIERYGRPVGTRLPRVFEGNPRPHSCQPSTVRKDNNLEHTEDSLSNCFGGDTGKNHR